MVTDKVRTTTITIIITRLFVELLQHHYNPLMQITLDGKPGDSNQLTEHSRFIGGVWYSSPKTLPGALKTKYEVLWQGITPDDLTPKPPAPAIKTPKKRLDPEAQAAATIAAIQSDSTCTTC